MRAFQQERKANEVCDKTLPALDLTNSTKPVNNQLISDLCIEDMSIGKKFIVEKVEFLTIHENLNYPNHLRDTNRLS